MCFKKLISLLKFKKKVITVEKLWQNDKLGYEQLADKFNSIIIDNSFSIISLEGYSGWGKTFFLKEWAETLKQQGEFSSYYSSWDVNAIDQPLVSFLNFLFDNVFTSHKINKSVVKQFTNINKELLSLNTLGKVINKSPLGMFSVLLDASKEADKKDIGSILRELGSLKRRKENIEDFKKQLSKIVNKIRSGKSIYIMIDDLEMCRPKFIIDFLESIKYFFNMEGFIFIFSINRDKNNVEKAINATLGSNFNVESFTDLSLFLPKRSTAMFIRKRFEDLKLPKESKNLIIDSFVLYSESFSLSLKTIEQCIKRIKLTYSEEKLQYPNLFSFLVILRSVNTSLYEELGYSQKESLEKIESEYRSAILNQLNGHNEWENLRISLENAFKEKGLKTIKQIKNILA